MATTVSPDVLQEPVSVDDNAGSLTVDATNLDVRDLAMATDSVAIGDGSSVADVIATHGDSVANTTNGLNVGAFGYVFNETDWVRLRGTVTDGMLVNLGANNDVVVSATNLDIRDLVQATDSVAIGDGTSAVVVLTAGADNTANTENQLVTAAMSYVFDGVTWDRSPGNATDGMLVNLGANNDVVVSATDLDIRNLAQATDSVAIGDGTDTVSILTDGADNVANTENQLVTAALTYGFDGTTWDRVTNGNGTAATALRVTLASDSTGTVIATGAAAHASPASGNPVYVAGRASTAIPADVGADGDVAAFWLTRNGAQVVTMAPHVGIFGSQPWNLTSETAQYTTTQTSTVLVAGGASERIVVTKVQIQVGGTTAGTLQLYFGTAAYSRGTSLAIFDGEFAPSATLKPGVIMDGPFISAANGDDLLVTDSAAINPLTITVWYYVVT